jgi:LysM repeat protein
MEKNMPVYNPIKPSLPKDEFRTYNKRKIFFVVISAILIIGSIVLLYKAFRPNKATNTEIQTEQKPTTTVPAETKTETQKETTTTTSGQTYKVESGDTLYTIGQKLNIDWHEIAKANNLKEPYSLKVGQELVIPASSTTSSSSGSQ